MNAHVYKEMSAEEEWAWWATLSPAGAQRARQELEDWQRGIKDGTYKPLAPQTVRVHKGGRPKRANTSTAPPTDK